MRVTTCKRIPYLSQLNNLENHITLGIIPPLLSTWITPGIFKNAFFITSPWYTASIFHTDVSIVIITEVDVIKEELEISKNAQLLNVILYGKKKWVLCIR